MNFRLLLLTFSLFSLVGSAMAEDGKGLGEVDIDKTQAQPQPAPTMEKNPAAPEFVIKNEMGMKKEDGTGTGAPTATATGQPTGMPTGKFHHPGFGHCGVSFCAPSMPQGNFYSYGAGFMNPGSFFPPMPPRLPNYQVWNRPMYPYWNNFFSGVGSAHIGLNFQLGGFHHHHPHWHRVSHSRLGWGGGRYWRGFPHRHHHHDHRRYLQTSRTRGRTR